MSDDRDSKPVAAAASASSRPPAPVASIAGRVTPLHMIAVKRGPGRPRKVEKQPTHSDLIYHATIAEERRKYVEDHCLVKQNPAPEGHSAIDKLKLVKAQIAKEVATLEFNRIELEKRGIDSTPVSRAIVSSASKIAEIELEIKKLGHTVIDPHSTEVQNILKFWLTSMRDVTTELIREGSLTTQTMDLLFNKLSAKMEGWEDRIEDK